MEDKPGSSNTRRLPLSSCKSWSSEFGLRVAETIASTTCWLSCSWQVAFFLMRSRWWVFLDVISSTWLASYWSVLCGEPAYTHRNSQEIKKMSQPEAWLCFHGVLWRRMRWRTEEIWSPLGKKRDEGCFGRHEGSFSTQFDRFFNLYFVIYPMNRKLESAWRPICTYLL